MTLQMPLSRRGFSHLPSTSEESKVSIAGERGILEDEGSEVMVDIYSVQCLFCHEDICAALVMRG